MTETKTTQFCDRCKCSVSRFETAFTVHYPIRDMLGDIVYGRDVKYELCRKCTSKLEQFLAKDTE